MNAPTGVPLSSTICPVTTRNIPGDGSGKILKSSPRSSVLVPGERKKLGSRGSRLSARIA